MVTFLWKIEVSRFSFILSKMYYLSEELFILNEHVRASNFSHFVQFVDMRKVTVNGNSKK